MTSSRFFCCAAALGILLGAPAHNAIAADAPVLSCPHGIQESLTNGGSAKLPELPFGTIMSSVLDASHFACTVAGDWVLANGDSIPDSTRLALLIRFNLDLYTPLVNTETNQISVPDLRGVFLRGHNYGRGGDTGNPENLKLGASQTDDVGPHIHMTSVGFANASAHDQADGWHGAAESASKEPVQVAGHPRAETRPRNVTVSYFIRIN